MKKGDEYIYSPTLPVPTMAEKYRGHTARVVDIIDENLLIVDFPYRCGMELEVFADELREKH